MIVPSLLPSHVDKTVVQIGGAVNEAVDKAIKYTYNAKNGEAWTFISKTKSKF